MVTSPVIENGYIMDVATGKERFYVLIMDYTGEDDAILTLDRSTSNVIDTIILDTNGACALEFDGTKKTRQR